jgi:hypothetical protein
MNWDILRKFGDPKVNSTPKLCRETPYILRILAGSGTMKHSFHGKYHGNITQLGMRSQIDI